MTQLVHITGEEMGKKIARVGINKGYGNGFVYFMPVSKNYYMSHQWARELKRSGIKCFSAIYFKIPDETMVWHGHYNQKHENERLSIALGKYLKEPDQLGYEFYVVGRIDVKCITKVVPINNILGWRYYPGAHDRKPCGCPACLSRGEYGSSRRRKKWKEENEKDRFTITEARQIIKNSNDIDDIYYAIGALSRKKRNEDPRYMFRVFDIDDDIIKYDGVKLLAKYRHPAAKMKLMELRNDKDNDFSDLVNDLLKANGWV
jgi:hypothetical protein